MDLLKKLDNMNKILFAEEFLKNYKNYTDHYADQEYSEFKLVEALQEFAKLHVEAALNQVYEKIDIEEVIDGIKNSILHAYPLENIK